MTNGDDMMNADGTPDRRRSGDGGGNGGNGGAGRSGPSQFNVSSGSYDGYPFPPEVLAYVWATVLTGSPFANNITALATSRGSVAFPTAAPTGAAWVTEGQPLPAANVGDSALISTPRKLATILSLSNESLEDAVIPIGDLTAAAIQGAMSAQMDDGLLHGDATPPQPDGILSHATAATAQADFRAAVIQAWGEVVSAGANADDVVAFANPAILAAEWMRYATGSGVPIHPDSSGTLTIGPGIETVAVPSLVGGATPEILVADTAALYLVQRDPLQIEVNPSLYFGSDSTAIRVKVRVACACPTPAKSLRKAVIS
jgi:HK97 family phage major capsid protein